MRLDGSVKSGLDCIPSTYGVCHMIKRSIREAIALARAGVDRKGRLHRVYVMATSPKWSVL